MQLNQFTPLPKAIKEQQDKSWQQFDEQYPEYKSRFSAKQLSYFKTALALSDFILQSALQAPDLVTQLFIEERIFNEHRPDYSQLLLDKVSACQSEEELHKQLRLCRLEQMVHIAVADLLNIVSLEQSLERLSALADALILTALNWLTEFCHHKWGIPYNNEGEQQSLLIYGMGKLGGRELNFSSDIDLIFVYPESGHTQGARRSIENQQFFTRLGQKLITALHQKTVDGFVYRVDMRLRPFGDSGPLVLTFNAMEDYYQEQGRDWERYAMLKARLIGEGRYHGALSSMLRPFVYRRYIDFSVIDSLRLSLIHI